LGRGVKEVGMGITEVSIWTWIMGKPAGRRKRRKPATQGDMSRRMATKAMAAVVLAADKKPAGADKAA